VIGIEELVYALCCQLSEALEKTEVGPSYEYEYIWMNDEQTNDERTTNEGMNECMNE